MDDDLKKTSWNVKQQTRNLPPAKARERIMRYIRRQGFTASPARSDRFGVGPNQHHLNYNENIGGPTHELAHAYMTPPGESLREHQKKMGNLTTPQELREMPVEQHRAEEHAAYAMEPQIKRRAGVSPAEASNGSYRYHADKMPTVHDAARARGVAQLDAIDEGRKVIGPKGQVGVGTSIDAKINARARGFNPLGKADELPANALKRPSERAEHTEEKSPWDVVSSAPAPTQKDLGLPTWLGRPVVHKDHLAELERAAAIHEFGHKMPRQAAEMKAYNDYVHKQRVQASAHHLAGMKAANAAGDEEAARKHYLLYKMHSEALGHDAAGPAHPDVVAASAAPQKVYRFKRHAGDAFVFAGDRGGPHEFGKQDLAKKEGMMDVREVLKALYDGAIALRKTEDDNKWGELTPKGQSKGCQHDTKGIGIPCGDKASVMHNPSGKRMCLKHAKMHGYSAGEKVEKKEKSPEDKRMKAMDRSARASKTTCPREGCGKYKPHWAEVCADCHHKGYVLGKGEVVGHIPGPTVKQPPSKRFVLPDNYDNDIVAAKAKRGDPEAKKKIEMLGKGEIEIRDLSLPELHKALHELWRGLKVLSKADDDKAMKARDRSAKASKTTCPECGEMKAYWAQTCPGCHRKKYAMGKGEVKATATKSVCRCPGYKFPHRHGGGACREKK